MSRLLDSEVYALRKLIPHVRPESVDEILTQLGYEGDYHLQCYYRHSNKTRQQWSLSFEVNGRQLHVSSERLDLLLWRVINHLRRHERARLIEQRYNEMTRPEFEI
jgi:hypothetical protein